MKGRSWNLWRTYTGIRSSDVLYNYKSYRKPVRIVSVVIGNTGIITKRCAENVKSLDCDIDITWLQKIAANETANLVTHLIGGKIRSSDLSPMNPTHTAESQLDVEA